MGPERASSFMRVGEYELPDELLYTKEHEWARLREGRVVVGITAYAVKMLHDVVYVELPREGAEVGWMGRMGAVESIKAASDLFSPVTGRVVRVNTALTDAPELVSQDPYGAGWMLEVAPTDWGREQEQLLTAAQYAELLRAKT